MKLYRLHQNTFAANVLHFPKWVSFESTVELDYNVTKRTVYFVSL